MTDRPYTDDDLVAEAARQHKTATDDLDFPGISEQMEGHKIPSRGEFQWDQLSDTNFDAAQRSIGDLLTSAADTSRWAIDLGADQLQPGAHAIDLGWSDGPLMGRIHIAWAVDVPDVMRERVVASIRSVIAGTVPVR